MTRPLETQSPAGSPEAEADVRRPRVLLADDEPVVLDFYRSVLAEDYDVTCARDGEEAIQLVRAEHFDIVVSDIAMPRLNGLQLLRAIREIDLDLPAILVTGAPTLDSAMQAVEYGALRYLAKPVQPAELRDVVRYGVRVHRMARAQREAYRQVSGRAGLAADRAGLEARFEAALDSIRLAFQPIISWSERRLVGYEALARCDEPTLAHPATLFGVAERLDRAPELGRSIRRHAARALAELPAEAALFVNLHHSDLNDASLYSPDMPLSQHVSRVVLELTERGDLDAVPRARRRIAELRELGYRIAVDDMGAGHNGLATFAALNPEVVKLDMLLVRGCDRDETRRELIRSMCGLCRELGIDFISEGVETAAERDALLSVGGDLFQGNLFGAPRVEIKAPRF